jgi:transcriptional regulator with XRE-family HTH domain
MPRITSSHEAVDFAVFGENVRTQRKLRGWSIDLLSKRAGLAPQTVLRIEHGYPSTRKKRALVAIALDTLPTRLERLPEVVREDIALHSQKAETWASLLDSRTTIPEDDLARIQTPGERERLGKIGFVTQFVKVLHCRLPKGKLVGGILEIYGPLLPSMYLGGEVFAYALSGDILVHLGDETFEMMEGESCTLDCTIPFFFEPKEATEKSKKPAQVLYVRLDDIVSMANRPLVKGAPVDGPVDEWVRTSKGN